MQALAAAACLLVNAEAPCCCLFPFYAALKAVVHQGSSSESPSNTAAPAFVAFTKTGLCPAWLVSRCCNKFCGSFMLACLPK